MSDTGFLFLSVDDEKAEKDLIKDYSSCRQYDNDDLFLLLYPQQNEKKCSTAEFLHTGPKNHVD